MTAPGRKGGKQSHLPLSGTCGARAGRGPRTHLGLGARRRGLRVGTGRRGCRVPLQSPGPAAPAPSSKSARAAGKAGGRERRRAPHAAPGCGAAATGPRDPARPSPTPRPEEAEKETQRGAKSARRAPQQLFPPPSAAGWVSARLYAGIFLGSQRRPKFPRRLRAAAHPRVTPRPPRGPPIVSSQQRRRGRAKPCLPPALGRAPGVRASRGGLRPSSVAPARRGAAPPRAAPQRPAPRCSLSRRRPRAARRRVRVAPSRRSPRARPAFLPPPPSSVPVCPGASPSPGALALGGAKGADRSPLAAPAPLPQDAWAASARTSLRSSRLGASYTSRTGGGRREGPGEKTGGTARPWPAGPSRGRCGRAGRVQMGEGRIPKLRRSRSCSPSATPKDMRVLRGAAQKEVDPLRSSRLDSS